MRIVLLAAIAALTFSGTALANETNADKKEDAAATEKEARDPNRRICKVTNVTGSRLDKQRICMTAAEWEQMRSDNNRFLSDRAKGSLPGD